LRVGEPRHVHIPPAGLADCENKFGPNDPCWSGFG
jgi:hypothetical protein